ncbi:MAG: helix-turn-helix domain-containing protein [Opitutaceae bacterium]|jgi:transcriptional regulator with XRE-family HTH domain|nr:helix-turn-helix domain-containing protein [Opitutaceae bacterium]
MPRPPINVSGPLIRKLRKARDWSQSDLAARCQLAGWDVGRDIIARIKGKIRLVRDSELVTLVEVFGVTPNELLPIKQRHDR